MRKFIVRNTKRRKRESGKYFYLNFFLYRYKKNGKCDIKVYIHTHSHTTHIFKFKLKNINEFTLMNKKSMKMTHNLMKKNSFRNKNTKKCLWRGVMGGQGWV
jgi:hypothetical protein